MSSNDKFDFKNFIPQEMYKDWFNAAVTNSNVYICIVQDQSQVGAIYMEAPSDELQNIEGVVRVFYSESDIKRYGKTVSAKEEISIDMIKKWELPFGNLIEHLLRLDKKYRDIGKKGIMAVASGIYDERFVNLDTVWTSEQKFMV